MSNIVAANNPSGPVTNRSEDRFRTMVELCPEAMFILARGKVVLTNRAGARLLGAGNADDLAGQPVADLVPSNRLGDVREWIESLSQGQDEAPRLEVPFLKRDGTLVDVELSGSAFTEAGQFAALVLARDVSGRKRSDAALRDSEERYRLIVENSTTGMALHVDGVIVYTNRAALDIIGASRLEDVLGRTVLEFVHPDERELIMRLVAQAFSPERQVRSARPLVVEERLIRLDGTIITVDASAIVVQYDGKPGLLVMMTDISERKRAQEALRLSEERYQLAMRGANDGLWDWDIKTGAVYYSPRWKSMLGYTEDELENTVDTWRRLVHPQDLERVNALVRDLIEGRVDAYEVELRMRHKAGYSVDILSRAFLVQHGSGGATRLVGTHVDITRRKQAEKALHATNQMLEAIVRACPLPIMALDRTAKASLWSPAAEDLFGWTAAEVLGTRLPIIPPSLSDAVEQEIREELGGVSRDGMEAQRQCKDGSLIDVCLWTAPLQDSQGQSTGSMAVGMDITRRKQAEAQLRYQAELMAAMQDAVIGVDAGYLIRSWNLAAETIYGWKAGEVIGRYLPDILPMEYDGTPPKSVRKAAAQYGSVQLEGRQMRKDGTWVTVESRVRAIRDDKGRISGYVGVIRDISSRKQAEEEIRSLAKFSDENPHPVARVGRDGTLLYANAACAPLLDLWDCQVGKTLSADLSHVTRTVLDSGVMQEIEVSCQERTYALFAVPIPDSRYVNVYGLDITARKRAEQSLQESEARFRAIFEHAPIGIALVDPQTAKPVKANKILQEILGYSENELVQMSFGDFTHADDFSAEWQLYQELIEGKRDSYQIEKRYTCKDGRVIWGSVKISLIENSNDQSYVIGMMENITESKQAQERLRQQMSENLRRNRELEAIVGVSSAMRQAESRPELVTLLLEQTLTTLTAQAAALALLNGSSLVFQGAVGKIEGWQGRALSKGPNIFWDALQKDGPRFVDCSTDPGISGFLAPLDEPDSGIQSGILIQLKSGPAAIGLLFIGYERCVQFSTMEKRLAIAIADMAGNALHRMSIADALEKLVADRTRDLGTIYKVTAAASKPVGQTAALQAALSLILTAAEAQSGAILGVDDKGQQIRVLAEKGMPPQVVSRIENPAGADSLESWVLANKKPLLIADVAADPRLDPSVQLGDAHVPFVALPMRVGERMVGILEIARFTGNQFDLEELTLLSFIADHLGLIIENARLLGQAEQNAVLAERSRLARELHDSVTQSLYSATLYAEGGRRLVERGDYQNVQDCLVQLGQVTQQALKEMRLMVFELRSPALRSEGLERAIQHRLDAVERRAGIGASLEIGQLPPLPEPMEEAVYRITLEALNNSLKHARARNVLVSIDCRGDSLCLYVADDGDGFDPAVSEESGGFGLTSMQERAERLRGSVRIVSEPGSGAEILAEFPLVETGHNRSLRKGSR